MQNIRKRVLGLQKEWLTSITKIKKLLSKYNKNTMTQEDREMMDIHTQEMIFGMKFLLEQSAQALRTYEEVIKIRQALNLTDSDGGIVYE